MSEEQNQLVHNMDMLMKQSFDAESIHQNRRFLRDREKKKNTHTIENHLVYARESNNHKLISSASIAWDVHVDDDDFQHSYRNMHHTDHNYHKRDIYTDDWESSFSNMHHMTHLKKRKKSELDFVREHFTNM